MTFRTFIPKRGDLVHLNFSPSAGHEMADRHYALVLSPLSYNRKSRMVVLCPITSKIRGWPFEVPVPANLLPDKNGQPVSSVIITDGVRQVDYRSREMELVSQAPRSLVEEVLDKLFTVLEEDE